MPVIVEQVSVETMPQAQASAPSTSAAPLRADTSAARMDLEDLPRFWAKLREREERVRAH